MDRIPTTFSYSGNFRSDARADVPREREKHSQHSFAGRAYTLNGIIPVAAASSSAFQNGQNARRVRRLHRQLNTRRTYSETTLLTAKRHRVCLVVGILKRRINCQIWVLNIYSRIIDRLWTELLLFEAQPSQTPKIDGLSVDRYETRPSCNFSIATNWTMIAQIIKIWNTNGIE